MMSSLAYSVATPIFSFAPLTTTAFFLPKNSTATVQYQVTNQTRVTRTLTLVRMSGISQDSSGVGYCGNPFTLAPQQSCTLSLVVDGSQITGTLQGGPEVCKIQGGGNHNPDPFLCAQPNQQDLFVVSSVEALPDQKLYISNWIGNSISLCEVRSIDGLLQNCSITASGGVFSNPEAVTIHPSKTFFYVANIGVGGRVTYCTVDSSSGALSGCALTGSSTTAGWDGIAINRDGTLAYVSNANTNNVSYCQVSSSTGALSACASTGNDFNVPSDLILNGIGNVSYVINLANSVSRCDVDGASGTLDCVDKIFGFDLPEGIMLHPSGLFAYITNNGNNTVTLCHVRPYTGELSQCHQTGGTFDGFGNLVFNLYGTRAYIPKLTLDMIVLCDVNLNNGELTGCRDAGATGLSGPSGLLVN